MYILYGGRFTRALITEMVMIEGDIAYELRRVDTVKGEHRSPEFLAINPAGMVPVLITPAGVTLTETPAINLYLVDEHGLTDFAPRPDEAERGPFLSGLFNLAGDLEPIMKQYFYPHRYVLRAEDTPAMKTKARDLALDRLGLIDRRLGEAGPYFLGKRFSLVDLTLAYWAANIDFDDALEPYRALKRCVGLIMTRPKLVEKFAELCAWRAEYRQMQARGEGVD